MTGLGVLVASRLKSMQGFQMIMNFIMMPMFFLSGAMFPLANAPVLDGYAFQDRPADLWRRRAARDHAAGSTHALSVLVDIAMICLISRR